MEVILLFDSSGVCPTCHGMSEYRSYPLSSELRGHLKNGGRVSIEFSDPNPNERCGVDEIFIAKKLGV